MGFLFYHSTTPQMKHFLILLLVAIITLTAVFLIYRPDLIEGIWLWAIGLIGPLIGYGKAGISAVRKFLNRKET